MHMPNWFIAFAVDVRNLLLHDPPAGLRLFSAADCHITVAFLGGVSDQSAHQAWAKAMRMPWHAVDGTFAEVRKLGRSALSAVVGDGRDALMPMLAQRDTLLESAGASPARRPPLPHVTLARMPRHSGAGTRHAVLEWVRNIPLADVRFHTTALVLMTRAEDRTGHLYRIVERLDMGSEL